MSKQFQVYLLPRDAELLIQKLRSELEVSILQSFSPKLHPIYLEPPLPTIEKRATRLYIAPTQNAEIRMSFLPSRSRWSISLESEAIEFDTCDCAENVLVRGRMYFQNDLLVNGMIIPKRHEFVSWADKLFRVAKKSLRWSKPISAYVGHEAYMWKKGGGRFARMVTPSRGPIFEQEPD